MIIHPTHQAKVSFKFCLQTGGTLKGGKLLPELLKDLVLPPDEETFFACESFNYNILYD